MTIITEQRTVNFTVSHEEDGKPASAWCDFFDNFPMIGELPYSKRRGWSFVPDSGVRAMSEAALRTAVDYWEAEWQQADGDTFESVAKAAADELGVEIY